MKSKIKNHKRSKPKSKTETCNICMSQYPTIDFPNLSSCQCKERACKMCLNKWMTSNFKTNTKCMFCATPMKQMEIENLLQQNGTTEQQQRWKNEKSNKKPNSIIHFSFDHWRTRLWFYLFTFNCFNCNSPLEKIDGCAHVECRCGQEICSRCCNQYHGHHSFCLPSIFKNPGCMLWFQYIPIIAWLCFMYSNYNSDPIFQNIHDHSFSNIYVLCICILSIIWTCFGWHWIIKLMELTLYLRRITYYQRGILAVAIVTLYSFAIDNMLPINSVPDFTKSAYLKSIAFSLQAFRFMGAFLCCLYFFHKNLFEDTYQN
jgi:hypothetical protein